MPAILAFRTVCRRCGHPRDPREFVAGGPTTGFCWDCLERHRKNLYRFHGEPVDECDECRTKTAELQRRCAPADLRMYLHVMDGLLALLCAECSAAYERKRRDLYGGTPYGHQKGIDA